MGGFMSGFGAAFSKSYSEASNRRHEKEQDAFRMYYNDYLDRRKTKESAEREDKKIVEKAEALAEITGSDPRAAYQWIKSGNTEDDYIKNIQNGMTSEVQQMAQPTPASQQTSEMMQPQPAGGNPQGQPQQAQGQQPDPNVPQDAGIFGNMFKRKDMQQKMQERIAQTSGTPIQDVQSTMETAPQENKSYDSGVKVNWKLPKVSEKVKDVSLRDAYQLTETAATPEEKAHAEKMLRGAQNAALFEAEAKAQAEGLGGKTSPLVKVRKPDGTYNLTRATKNADGHYVDLLTKKTLDNTEVEEISELEFKEMGKIREEFGKDVSLYTKELGKFASAERLTGEMLEIVQRNPKVIGFAGRVASTVDKFANDVNGTLDLMTTKAGDMAESGASVNDGIRYLAEAEARLAKLVPTNEIQKTALDNAMFEAKAIRLAYIKAAAEGQTGTGVAAKELQAFLEEIKAKSNPQAFVQLTQDWLGAQKEGLDIMHQSLTKNNGAVRDYADRWGYEPSPLVPSVDEFMGGRSQPEGDPAGEANKVNQLSPTKDPEVGAIEEDENGEKWEFLGGNPTDSKNWKRKK